MTKADSTAGGHTPGPWNYSGTGCNVGGPDMVRVADCSGLERSPEERQANCRLIAAAPELLEIARWAEAALSYMAHTSPTREDRPEFARRFAFAHHVIAKAQGRAYVALQPSREELAASLRETVAALEAAGADGEPGEMPSPALDRARLLLGRLDGAA